MKLICIVGLIGCVSSPPQTPQILTDQELQALPNAFQVVYEKSKDPEVGALVNLASSSGGVHEKAHLISRLYKIGDIGTWILVTRCNSKRSSHFSPSKNRIYICLDDVKTMKHVAKDKSEMGALLWMVVLHEIAHAMLQEYRIDSELEELMADVFAMELLTRNSNGRIGGIIVESIFNYWSWFSQKYPQSSNDPHMDHLSRGRLVQCLGAHYQGKTLPFSGCKKVIRRAALALDKTIRPLSRVVDDDHYRRLAEAMK